MRAGVLTVSDKGHAGQRPDASGPAVRAILEEVGATVEQYEVIPDDLDLIAAKLKDYADRLQLDLIITTGGTGVSPRDVTPDATRQVLDREIPGFAEAMRMASLKVTPHAMISRAMAGVRSRTLIVNLPGSPKGASENLRSVLPAIPHAIAKIKGDPSECA